MSREESTPSVVQIDENNLDRECIRLPGDYLKYSTRSADLKRDLSEAAAKVKVAQAEASTRIRENPAKYGIEKLTEAAVAAAVLVDAKYQEALENEREIQHSMDLAQAVVWALEHKKRSLSLLVDLHGMGYFSSVRTTAAGKTAVEEMTKKKVRRRDEEGD